MITAKFDDGKTYVLVHDSGAFVNVGDRFRYDSPLPECLGHYLILEVVDQSALGYIRFGGEPDSFSAKSVECVGYGSARGAVGEYSTGPYRLKWLPLEEV